MDKINQSAFVKQVEAAPAGEGIQLVPGLLKLVDAYQASPEEIAQATAAFQAQTLTAEESTILGATDTASPTSSSRVVAVPIAEDKETGRSRLMLFEVGLGKLVSNTVYEVELDRKALLKATEQTPITFTRLDEFTVGFPVSTFGQLTGSP